VVGEPVTSLVHQRWPGLDLARVSLGTTPTPIRPLRLSGVPDGVALWVKAEDSFGGPEWGGNKVRKLEWIIPEAQRRAIADLGTALGGPVLWLNTHGPRPDTPTPG
jgi:D-cysteine desulfhydrase